MSGIMLNLEFNGPSHAEGQDKHAGNRKHMRFVKSRRHLEKKGLLNKKQNAIEFQKEGFRDWHSQKNKRKEHSQTGAIFPKFVTSQHERSTNPSSSMQAHHKKYASETGKKFSVPSRTSRGESTSALHRVTPCLGKTHKYVALDCEMVGTGPKGQCSELARCSIVTYDGDVIYDKYIKPVNPVTDYRTRWSGIRKRDVQNATPFKQAQREVRKYISIWFSGCVL